MDAGDVAASPADAQHQVIVSIYISEKLKNKKKLRQNQQQKNARPKPYLSLEPYTSSVRASSREFKL